VSPPIVSPVVSPSGGVVVNLPTTNGTPAGAAKIDLLPFALIALAFLGH
jgi:hypothetical protein